MDVPNVPVLPTCDATGKGRLVYNTSDNKMYFCNGTAWTDMTVGAIALPYSGSSSTTGSNASFSLTDRGTGRAIFGENTGGGIGIYGSSDNGTAVYGNSIEGIGGTFINNSLNPTLYVRNVGKGKAAEIVGDVAITNDLTIKNNKGVAYNQNSSTNLRMFQYVYILDEVITLCENCNSNNYFEFMGGFSVLPSVFVGDHIITNPSMPSLKLSVKGCSFDAATKVTGCIYVITNPYNQTYTVSNLQFNCLAIGY